MVAVEISGAKEAEERIPKEARRILHSLASGWSDVADSRDLEVVQLKGAMTNEVFQINWKVDGRRNRKVLVRIYGEGVDVFFDRADEVRTFEFVSRHRQGPRLLGRFANGRVEEFIHARVCLIFFDIGAYFPPFIDCSLIPLNSICYSFFFFKYEMDESSFL